MLYPCILRLVSCLGTKRHLYGLLSVQVFLNLVLEFVPETVYRISKHYSKNSQRMPTLFVKLYVYQVGSCNSSCCLVLPCVAAAMVGFRVHHLACGVVAGEGRQPFNTAAQVAVCGAFLVWREPSWSMWGWLAQDMPAGSACTCTPPVQ